VGFIFRIQNRNISGSDRSDAIKQLITRTGEAKQLPQWKNGSRQI
jgi:hypothetical protein